MKYGEKLVITTWVWYYKKKGVLMGYRYRIDPIPWVSKRGHYNTGRKPRVMNEKRQWYKSDLGRKKRSPLYLPDTWDNRPRTNFDDRSWKTSSKYRKQWEK